MMRKVPLIMRIGFLLALFLCGIPTNDGRGQGPPRLAKTITSTKDGAPMVLVPGGPFTSGMNRSDLRALLVRLKELPVSFYDTEFPETTRVVSDFYIDRYEVTNERYGRFVKATGHHKPAYWDVQALSHPIQPVVGVGWGDAERYCKWAGKRLPSEMEWEKAARGTDKRIWPWGNDPDDKNYNGRKMGVRVPIDVGSLPAGDSFYGVSDMAGNVWEMTSSKWPSEQQPSGRVMKGGSFLNTNADVRVMVRWAAQNEKEGATWLGFRCVMDPANVQEFARRFEANAEYSVVLYFNDQTADVSAKAVEKLTEAGFKAYRSRDVRGWVAAGGVPPPVNTIAAVKTESARSKAHEVHDLLAALVLITNLEELSSEHEKYGFFAGGFGTRIPIEKQIWVYLAEKR